MSNNNKPFFVDVATKADSIYCWTRDQDFNLNLDVYPIKDYCYCFQLDNTSNATGWKSLYGQPLKKVDFDSQRELKKFAEGRQDLFDSDVSAVTKFLLENFNEGDLFSPVNVMLYDIEVDFDLSDGIGYPSVKNPYGEINAISSFNKKEMKYVMVILDKFKDTIKLKDKEFPVEIHWVVDERDLLLTFSEIIEDMDVIAAWNGDAFDLPYIMERAELNFGEKSAKSLFCRDGFNAHKRHFTNDFKEEVWEWTLAGRQHIDLMKLYKKFVPGERSFKLDDVVRDELGMEKISFEDDLGSLYRENPQKFFEYSLHDSRLLYYLDEKLQIAAQAILIARTSCVKISKVTGAVTPIETALMKYCRKKGNIILPDKKFNIKKKFIGAIVYDTLPGRHGWGFTIDLASLYPSTMVLLGCSPETLLMQCSGGMEDYIAIVERRSTLISIKTRDDEEFELPAYEVDDIVRSSGYTISGNGTIFSGELGILAEFVQDGMNLREEYKKEKAINESLGNFDLAKSFDLRQKVTKINNNSVYGVTGEATFKLFDIRIAQSITLTAQFISKHQAANADRYIGEEVAA